MAKLLAPYNNMMRLGQGFNSFTQEICIDDAVVIDVAQKENVVNNAGMTMKMLAVSTINGLIKGASSEKENKEVVQPKSFLRSTEEEANKIMGKEEKEQKSENKVVKKQETVRESMKNAKIDEAMSKDEMIDKVDGVHQNLQEKQDKNVQGVRAGKDHKELPWSSKQAIGPAQIVTYQSKFVNNISEITDDMGISGSLAIKYNAIGGSGSGAFFDAEKFYDSDLKYYISVKVTNQSINFKDPLAFNPLRSSMHDPDKFKAVFGDSFISGFLEGGEFNALILMNVHNRQKKRDIEAEAKVALTAGPVEISAQGNLKLAEENIKNNTEMTVYVRWCGGGNIKPYDEDWTIESVSKAASRFPSLVGLFPQRTYAILTKYDTLRSYLCLKPPAMTPLRYEVAQMYTNMLLDSYMEYKSLSKRLAADMTDVQSGIKHIKARPDDPKIKKPQSLIRAHLNPYKTTIEGLDCARRDIQKQMNIITAELELLAKNPELATDEKRVEPFVGSATFQFLLPICEVVEIRKRTTASPMDLRRINPSVEPKEAPLSTTSTSDQSDSPPLFDAKSTAKALPYEEQKILEDLEWQSFGIGKEYQVSMPVGSENKGTKFCTLNFAQTDAIITDIFVILDQETKKLATLCFTFNNGLTCTLGKTVNQEQLDSTPHKLLDIGSKPNYNVNSILLQILDEQVVGLKISAGKEMNLIALCSDVPKEANFEFKYLSSFSRLSGMWGRADEQGIYRLGFIWGRYDETNAPIVYSADGDEMPGVAGMVYLDKDSSSKSQKDVRYFPSSDVLPDDPRHLLYAPCFIKGDEKSVGVLKMGAEVGDVTYEGFTLIPNPPVEKDALTYSWMVIPQFEDFQADSNTLMIDCKEHKSINNLKVSIPFEQPFVKRAPTVLCWFTVLDVRPKDNEGPIFVKVRSTGVNDSGFTIEFESEESTICENVSVGWLAYSAPELKDNARFNSAQTQISEFGKDSKKEVALAPNLCQSPNHTFLALNEIRLNSTKQAVDLNVGIKEKDKVKLLFKVGSISDTYDSLKSVGIVCIASA